MTALARYEAHLAKIRNHEDAQWADVNAWWAEWQRLQTVGDRLAALTRH